MSSDDSKDLKSTSSDTRSKSEIKRETQAITQLGERLLSLTKQQLEQLDLSDASFKAIIEGQKIKSHIGRKRQIKFIGKSLRNENHQMIAQKIHFIDQQKMLKNKQFHNIEQWRDRLVSEGDNALSELLNSYPSLDRQQLRQLIRNAQLEVKNNKPPKNQRELFRFLQQNCQESE